jgi:hypothetical protein
MFAYPLRQNNQDADEIISGIWVSRWEVAHNVSWLKEKNIQTVFNCTKDIPFHPSVPHCYRIPVDDNLAQSEITNMEVWAAEIAYTILREFRAGRKILIHCHAGMQRSTTATAFFLMVFTRDPLLKVLSFIKQKRKIAFLPAPNFFRALVSFEQQIQAKIAPAIAPAISQPSTLVSPKPGRKS